LCGVPDQVHTVLNDVGQSFLDIFVESHDLFNVIIFKSFIIENKSKNKNTELHHDLTATFFEVVFSLYELIDIKEQQLIVIAVTSAEIIDITSFHHLNDNLTFDVNAELFVVIVSDRLNQYL